MTAGGRIGALAALLALAAPAARAEAPPPSRLAPGPTAGPTADSAAGIGEALRHYEAGRYTEAADDFGLYLKRHPDERRIWRLLGDCALHLRRWDEAVTSFHRALQYAQPDKETQAAREGLAAARLRADNAARYREVLARSAALAPTGVSPDSAEWHLRFGAALEGQGKAAEAAEVYRYFLFNHEDVAAMHLRLARVLRPLGQVDAALEEFRRLTLVAPDEIEGWSGYVDLLLERSRAPEALQVAYEAVARFGDEGGFRRVLARLYLDADRPAAAARQYAVLARCQPGRQTPAELRDLKEGIDRRLERLRSDVERAPQDFEAAEALKDLLVALGRGDDAVRLFEARVRQFPSHFGVKRTLGALYYQTGHFLRAREVYEGLLRDSQGDLVLRLEYARLLGWLEEYDDALAELEALRTIAPDDPRVSLYRAYTWMWKGDVDRARGGFAEAEARNPGDPSIRQQLRLLDGDYTALLPAQIRKYNLDPLDRDGSLGLADLLHRMGDGEGAGRLYRDYVALYPEDTRARRSYARVLADLGDHPLAIRQCLYLIDRVPEKRDLLLEDLAFIYLWGGEYAEARRTFQDLLSRHPARVRLLLGMGRSSLWDEAPYDALYWFGLALSLEPGNREAQEAWAVASRAATTFWEEAALDACSHRVAFVEEDPGEDLLFPLPRVDLATGDPTLTLDVLLSRGMTYYGAGDFDELAELYHAYVLALPPGHPGRLGLATFREYLDRLRSKALRSVFGPEAGCAVADPVRLPEADLKDPGEFQADVLVRYTEALKKDPKDRQALLGLAWLYSRRGALSAHPRSSPDLAEAARRYAEYLRVEPGDHRVRLRLAFLYYQIGQYALAADLLERSGEAYADRPCLDLYRANALNWAGPARPGSVEEVVGLYMRYQQAVPDASWVWGPIAQLWREARRYDLAAEALEKALVARPGDRDLSRAYALVLAEGGRLDDAMRFLESRGSRDDDEALVLALVRAVFRASGASPDPRVLALVERYLAAHPGDRRIRLELARGLARAGRADAAHGQFDAYVRAHPDDVEVLMEMVGMLNSARLWDLSLAAIDRHLARRPDDLVARKARADVVSWRGIEGEDDRKFVIETYERFLASQPRHPETLKALALAYADIEAWGRAEELISLYRQVNPYDEDGRATHALVLARLGRDAEAIPLLEATLARRPNDVDAIVLLVQALNATSAPVDRVRPWLDRLRALHQRDALPRPGLLAFARLLAGLGDRPRAAALFAEYARDAAPDDPVRREMAWLLIAEERWSEAISLLEGLAAAAPSRDEYALDLARALAWSGVEGHRGRAVPLLDAYLRRRPEDVAARLLLAALLADLGDLPRAHHEYRAVLERRPLDPERRGAELGLVRISIASGRMREALDVAEALAERRPRDAEAILARAQALDAGYQGGRALADYRLIVSGELDATPEVRAAARSAKASLELRSGPRIEGRLDLVADSDSLVSLTTQAAAGHRFSNLRTYLGARYTLAFGRLHEPLQSTDAAGAAVTLAEAGIGAVHALVLEAHHRFGRSFTLSGQAGADLDQDLLRPGPDLRIQAELDRLPAGLTAGYAAWYRAAWLDLKSMGVLDAGRNAFWQRAHVGVAPGEGEVRIDGSYLGSVLWDGNVFHDAGASLVLSPRRLPGLKAGFLFDYLTWMRPSTLHWDPRNGIHARGLLAYGLSPAPGLEVSVQGTVGGFHEDGWGAFEADLPAGAVTMASLDADVLTYGVQAALAWRAGDRFTLDARYAFGQSGPGLVTAYYRAHSLSLNAVGIW